MCVYMSVPACMPTTTQSDSTIVQVQHSLRSTGTDICETLHACRGAAVIRLGYAASELQPVQLR